MSSSTLRCRFCKKVQRTLAELIGHERVHTGEKPFICKHCLAGFTWKASLKLHEGKCGQRRRPSTKSQTNITTEPVQSRPTQHRRKKGFLVPPHVIRLTVYGKTCYSCDFCKRIFKSNVDCERHIRTHTGETPFKCPYCPKAFNRKGGLKIHENMHTRCNLFQCQRCLKSFTAKSALNRHETACSKSKSGESGQPNSNHGNLTHTKMILETETSSKQNATTKPMGTSLSTPDLEFLSRVKGRKVRITNPNATRIVVNGKLTYSCNFCKKTFKGNTPCLRHTRIHTGEKPFSCSYCPKSFSWKTNATVHERTHTGEKPYVCLIQSCGRRFKSSADLNAHLKRKTHLD